ncbi:hypothetical protein HYY75_06150 [bacterium]|nr:hypothetical protein [bacterium]
MSFTVDAFRERRFRGKVGQVRLQPTISQNVVNYSVMVNVKNDDFALKPGMTANVEIHVAKRENVIRIPTRAMFFKPPKEIEDSLSVELEKKGSDTSLVWLLEPPEKIKPIEVKIGLSNNSFSEILSGGLTPGQVIVVGERKGEKSDKGSQGSMPGSLRRTARVGSRGH